jgi:hypothetical protein
MNKQILNKKIPPQLIAKFLQFNSYPSFCSMQLGVLLPLDWVPVHHRLPLMIGTHLYSWLERSKLSVLLRDT